MYFDIIFILRKAAISNIFCIQRYEVWSPWALLWGFWGCCGRFGGKEAFFLTKRIRTEVLNDIKHTPFENKTFTEAMSLNPPTIRIFKCMYDTVSETIARACFVRKYCKYLLFKSHRKRPKVYNSNSEFPCCLFYFSVIVSLIFLIVKCCSTLFLVWSVIEMFQNLLIKIF